MKNRFWFLRHDCKRYMHAIMDTVDVFVRMSECWALRNQNPRERESWLESEMKWNRYAFSDEDYVESSGNVLWL